MIQYSMKVVTRVVPPTRKSGAYWMPAFAGMTAEVVEKTERSCSRSK